MSRAVGGCSCSGVTRVASLAVLAEREKPERDLADTADFVVPFRLVAEEAVVRRLEVVARGFGGGRVTFDRGLRGLAAALFNRP